MALLVPDVGEVILLAHVLYGGGGTITAATNATPTVITTGANHGLSNGNSVYNSGDSGNTNINGGPFTAYNITANTYQIMTVTTTVTGTAINGNGVSAGTRLWCLGGVENGTLKLRNDAITPAEGDTAGTYTESTFTGYSTKSLVAQNAAANWAVPSTSGGVTSSTYGTVLTWTATSTQSVIGYFVVGATSGTLWWAENFGASQNLANGITLNLTSKLQLD